MSVKERIKTFIDYSEMTVSAFEKSINVTNGYINSISKSIGIDKINVILEKYPNLNIEWLFTGNGEMLKKSTENELNVLSEPNSSYGKINDPGLEAFLKYMDNELVKEKFKIIIECKLYNLKTTKK